MLDRYTSAIVNRLSNVIAAVATRRGELERQRSTDRFAQSYLGTALKHPEGHTTPLRKSAERAQQEYAAVRAEWAKKGPEALALFATLMVARERRDETKAVWERHDAAEMERVSSKYHPEVRRLFGQLFDHGITPAMIEQLWPETIGLIADVILWQVSDPEGEEESSPLPALFEMYAERTMVMPGGASDPGRSVPGIAPEQVRYSDPPHYRFDDIAAGLGNPALADTITDPAVDADSDPVDAAIDPGEAPPPVPAVMIPDQPTPTAEVDQLQPQPAMPALDRETTTVLAQQILATDPHVRIYWPRDYPAGDFNEDALIAALRREVATGEAWSGKAAFLAAAQAGEATSFIADRRQESIRWLANDLHDGKPDAIERARKAGLWSSGTGSGPS